MFSCSPFFLFGKDGDFLSAKNTFPEASGNAPPTFKYFPKLRKTPRRRKSTFRNFGNFHDERKMFPESSGSSAAAEKRFPKLREALPCRGNTKKAATITCDSFTSFYKINRLSQERNQDTGSHSRTDNTRNITCHAILKHMVLRIIFQRNLIGHTRCHRHGT